MTTITTITTHKCYPGSAGNRLIGVRQLFTYRIWCIAIPPRGFFAWLATADWYKIRFCPWCGEQLPQLKQ